MEKENNPVDPVVYKNNPKIISIISYFTLVGWLLGYILNSEQKNEIASFHLRQSLGIFLLFLASGMVAWIPILGWIASGVGFILGVSLWILGFISAIKQESDEVPVLGYEFQRWFAGI